MDNAADRRQFWRAAFHSTARLVDKSGTSPVELLDISLKGALVNVPPHWHGEAGETCQLKLSLADNAFIAMRASVAHVEGRRVGLRCENVDLDSITHLRRLVELNAGDATLLDRELHALLG
ncbi:MAG: PilZ domain-containing protein [Rhodocyclaceae bacterium]|nr:PilZ domain-containing protein [Rhodocyclaceae bacterium]